MTGKPIDSDTQASILAEWRTGAYSQRDLAARHRVSNGFVAKLCKGVEADTAAIVSAGVAYKQGLALQNEQSAHIIVNMVDEKTRHIQLFNSVTEKNINLLSEKITSDISIRDHREIQATLKDGKETVLGKDPAVAVQVNNTIGIITRRILKEK
jgi:hypothetical protein